MSQIPISIHRKITITNNTNEITHYIDLTLRTYWNMISDIIPIAEQHWDDIKNETNLHKQRNILEKYIKQTNFPKKYKNVHSYLKRDAYHKVIEHLSLYFGNLKIWENTKKSKRGRKPRLCLHPHLPPTLYNKEMYQPYKQNEIYTIIKGYIHSKKMEQ